jgi:hypothetical protein
VSQQSSPDANTHGCCGVLFIQTHKRSSNTVQLLFELLNPTSDNHIIFLPLVAFLVHQNVNDLGWQNMVVKILEKEFIITVPGHDFRWGKTSLWHVVLGRRGMGLCGW